MTEVFRFSPITKVLDWWYLLQVGLPFHHYTSSSNIHVISWHKCKIMYAEEIHEPVRTRRAGSRRQSFVNSPNGMRENSQSNTKAVSNIRWEASKLTIPVWLMQLEEEYRLDVGQFPEKISPLVSINRSNLRDLPAKLQNHCYIYRPQLKTFHKGDCEDEV